MNKIEEGLKVILSKIEEKYQKTMELFEYGKKQKEILKDDEFDVKKFNEIIRKKKKLIDAISDIDKKFEPLYNEIKLELDYKAKEYINYIEKINQIINKTSKINSNISILEKEIKFVFEEKMHVVKKQVKQIRTTKKTVNNYYFGQIVTEDNGMLFDSKK